MDAVGYFLTFLGIFVLWLLLRAFMLLRVNSQRTKKLLQMLPTPPQHWLLGHIHNFPGVNLEGLTWFEDAFSRWGDTFLFCIGPLQSFVMTQDAGLIRRVLNTSEPKMIENGPYGFLKQWIGDGLLISKGNKWFRNRRLLTPAFHFDILKQYIDVYNDASDKLLDTFHNYSAATGKSMDVYRPGLFVRNTVFSRASAPACKSYCI